MKPKNRYFCMGCQRPKMLFESKSKADNFLKFNKDDFNKTPTRSYFCSFCGGWHISIKSPVNHFGKREGRFSIAKFDRFLSRGD